MKTAELTFKQNKALEEAIQHIENYLHDGEYQVEVITDNILLVKYPEQEEEYVITVNNKNKPLATLLTYIDGQDVEITINSL